MDQLRPLICIIVGVAALAYVGGIGYAGYLSLTSDNPVVPDIVTQAVTVIGGALGTHFGAIFGISQLVSGTPANPPPVARLNVFTRSSVLATPANATPPPSALPLDKLQVAAAYFYVFALLLGAILWGATGFSSKAADILKNISYSLIGVIGGVVAVALNVRR
jgi:hypothetical protein